MDARLKSIILVVVCTVFTALGQLFYKLSSTTFELDIIKLITNYNLILGLFFYFVGAMLLVLALKFGELSTVYPFVSLTFIWVFIIGIILFSELITPLKIIGTVVIIGGVSFIAKG